MVHKLILLFGLTLVSGFVLAEYQESRVPKKFCSWTRCPYYEAPLAECDHYSDFIPVDTVSKVLQDNDEGLILASECSEVQ